MVILGKVQFNVHRKSWHTVSVLGQSVDSSNGLKSFDIQRYCLCQMFGTVYMVTGSLLKNVLYIRMAYECAILRYSGRSRRCPGVIAGSPDDYETVFGIELFL